MNEFHRLLPNSSVLDEKDRQRERIENAALLIFVDGCIPSDSPEAQKRYIAKSFELAELWFAEAMKRRSK